jgi:hypothetical protein
MAQRLYSNVHAANLFYIFLRFVRGVTIGRAAGQSSQNQSEQIVG